MKIILVALKTTAIYYDEVIVIYSGIVYSGDGGNTFGMLCSM